MHLNFQCLTYQGSPAATPHIVSVESSRERSDVPTCNTSALVPSKLPRNQNQNLNLNSLLVKRQNDNHSPGALAGGN